MVPFSKIRIKKKSGRKGKMKKSIKVGLILLIAMCASISGCGKKNTKITKEKIKKAATTANQNNETKTTKKKLKKPIYTKGVIKNIKSMILQKMGQRILFDMKKRMKRTIRFI